MKILHINRNYLTSALHQVMMNHMNKAIFSHTVFAPTDDIYKSVIIPNENVISSICFSNIDRYFYDIKQMKIRKALEKRIHVEEYHLIHAYTLFTDGNCAMKLSQKYGLPYVVAIRNTDVNDFFRRLPYLRRRGIKIMRRASKVFFLSTAYRNQVFEKYVPMKYRGELLEKTEIIPNGVDDFWIKGCLYNAKVDSFKRIQRKKLNLIFVGRIDSNKNIPTTVEAIKVLQKKGWDMHLTIVGKIENEKEYAKFSGQPFVSYYPAVGKEKLLEFYQQNDIFIMPSHTESFGLVYVEAMSQGLPVIYTRGQGFDGQFDEGVVGFAVSDNSPQNIAEAIEKIVSNYSNISYNCARLADRYEWNKICDRYTKIYEAIDLIKH